MSRTPQVPEISPQDLTQAIERGDRLQVLDVRAPARVVTGRIDLVTDEEFHNVVGSRLLTMQSQSEIGLDPSVPVAVVCGHGNSSKPATAFLNQAGYQARSVRGGMAAWMSMTVARDLPAPASLDRLVQFDRVGKGSLGYLLVSDGAALVVDPPRDPSDYLTAAQDGNAQIIGVADTHAHADYVSGGPALAASLDVPYYLHPADAIYPYDGTPGTVAYTGIEDGQTIQVGRASIRAVHTPGHTEGSLTYLVDDSIALTGDFLFIASVGRPDLAGKSEEWTPVLWRSIEQAKSSWHEGTIIYPAHYASQSERQEDRTVGTALGNLLHTNPVLRIPDQKSFTEWVRRASGTFPDSYRIIKAVNVGLKVVDELEAEELEVGRNECAVVGG